MLFLEFSKDGSRLFRYPITHEKVTIGRDETCSVMLTDGDLSRLHCEIYRKNGDLFVRDMSRNGTLKNSAKIKKDESLAPSDRLSLGRWTVDLSKDAEVASDSTAVNDECATKIIGFDNKTKTLLTEAVELSVSPPGGEKRSRIFRKTRIDIGSKDGNDLVVDDAFISKKHCRLEFDGNSLILTDLGSTNGTLYNEEPIERIELPENGRFTIGKTNIFVKRIKEKEKLPASGETQMGQMIGASKAMKEVFALVGKVAPTDATVIITGESGTGKELVARSIHSESGRRAGPFVAINCAAIPHNIIESELFGHEKGSFTGAMQTHQGVFEQADKGTLFLDEIGEMGMDLQTRLLRVLETKVVRRIGGKNDIPVDVRIIAATNQDLKSNIRSGKFREDLFFRLYIVPLHIPPLRERRDDIGVMARYFTRLFSIGGAEHSFTPRAMEMLMQHNWAGNVRELKNTIQRAMILNKGSSITPGNIHLTELRSSSDFAASQLFNNEKEAIVDALRRCGGNRTKAAQYLGIARTTIANKIRKHKIDVRMIKMI